VVLEYISKLACVTGRNECCHSFTSISVVAPPTLVSQLIGAKLALCAFGFWHAPQYHQESIHDGAAEGALKGLDRL
jgi:hypothetical protein